MPKARPSVPIPDDTPALAALAIGDEVVALHPLGTDHYATTIARVNHCYRRSARIAESLFQSSRPRCRIWRTVRDTWWRYDGRTVRAVGLTPEAVLRWATEAMLEPEPRHSVGLRTIGWIRGDE